MFPRHKIILLWPKQSQYANFKTACHMKPNIFCEPLHNILLVKYHISATATLKFFFSISCFLLIISKICFNSYYFFNSIFKLIPLNFCEFCYTTNSVCTEVYLWKTELVHFLIFLFYWLNIKYQEIRNKYFSNINYNLPFRVKLTCITLWVILISFGTLTSNFNKCLLITTCGEHNFHFNKNVFQELVFGLPSKFR